MDIQHLSMLEAAQRLGITLPAAESRLLRARTGLRQRILKVCGPRCYYMPRSSVQYMPARSAPSPDSGGVNGANRAGDEVTLL